MGEYSRNRNFGYLYFTGVINFQLTFFLYSLYLYSIIYTFYSLHLKNSLITPISFKRVIIKKEKKNLSR